MSLLLPSVCTDPAFPTAVLCMFGHVTHISPLRRPIETSIQAPLQNLASKLSVGSILREHIHIYIYIYIYIYTHLILGKSSQCYMHPSMENAVENVMTNVISKCIYSEFGFRCS